MKTGLAILFGLLGAVWGIVAVSWTMVAIEGGSHVLGVLDYTLLAFAAAIGFIAGLIVSPA